MGVCLVRIDERLIHGQVVVGWGEHLDLDYFVICDPELAESSWEQELYEAAAPPDADVLFLAPDAPVERWREVVTRDGRGALLARTTGALRRLAETGVLEGHRVNVGGLHAAPGRRRVTDYLYLSEGELDDLRAVRARTAGVEARDVPGSGVLTLEEMADAAGGA